MELSMTRQLGELIERWANFKTLLLIILLALPFNIIFFPWRNSRLSDLSGVTEPFLDARFTYTPSTLNALFAAYGQSGRRLYALSEVTIDLIYPILYTLFLSLLISLILTKVFPDFIALKPLSFLPFVILLSDYTENFSLVILSLRHPNRIDWLAHMASLFTSIKWMVLSIIIVFILLGLAALAIRYVRHKILRYPIGK
jgi:hypothetical protein